MAPGSLPCAFAELPTEGNWLLNVCGGRRLRKPSHNRTSGQPRLAHPAHVTEFVGNGALDADQLAFVAGVTRPVVDFFADDVWRLHRGLEAPRLACLPNSAISDPRTAVVLGQHVMVGPAGAVAGRMGAITSAADSLQIRLFARGVHASMPQASIDAVVMAAATVMRLTNRGFTGGRRCRRCRGYRGRAVGRYKGKTSSPMRRSSSLTCARLMWRHVLAAIERTVKAEAAASGAPRAPEITPLDRYPLNVNNREAITRVAGAFHRHFPPDRVWQTGPAPASEDFGSFGTEWQAPSVFWFVGGTDPDTYAKAKKAGHLNDIPVYQAVDHLFGADITTNGFTLT